MSFLVLLVVWREERVSVVAIINVLNLIEKKWEITSERCQTSEAN